ncbi:MAG: ribosome-associated translation inhibitor RaiA [Puniceicoccales bacterium]|jgi:putative sigma-54 modulation protein|nr:ribosome-associated translation inhibitor RaiA [Puniceicoccales bacterium]
MNKDAILITGLNLELTDAIKNRVTEKMTKLFKHNDRIIRVKVELESPHAHSQPAHKLRGEFIAKAQVELSGPSIAVSVKSEDLYKSLELLTTKLIRQIRRRHRLKKEKRNHPHKVDIPAELPKLVA